MINELKSIASTIGPPRCQGARPSCLAFATSDLNQVSNKLDFHLSVEYLSHHAAKLISGWKPSHGLTVKAVLDSVNAPGQPKDDDYPYQAADHDMPTKIPPSGHTLYSSMCTKRNLILPDITKAILAGRAVCLVVAVTKTFRAPVDGIVTYSSTYYPKELHALLAVGLGDHQVTGEKHYLIRNSWGAAWGQDGHAWLPSQYLATHLRDSFVL